MTNALSIANVISISVSQSAQALNAFNTSNLALFTAETPNGTFPGAGYALYLDATAVGVDFGTSSVTYQAAVAIFSQAPNILAGGGYLVVIAFTNGETLAAAIARTKGLVSYYGVCATQIESDADLAAAATVVQAENMVAFFPKRLTGAIAASGSLDLLRSGSLTKSRGLFYYSTTDTPAILYAAAYAGRALSTNFNGSNTVATMHLKPLAGISPDPQITQTILATAVAAGADTYVSIQGVPVTFCSGGNNFFDQTYNLGWLVGALQVAGFNYLAGAATKLPQTENGMDGLKGAYRAVCEQAKTNGYCAPGTWTSSTTFGVQKDMLANIAQQGYYIYSQPISQQANSARIARQAPLVQIAIKEAGAMHSSAVIVNVNA